MMLWIVLAAMTAAAVAALLLPLLRAGRTAPARADHELAVYRDQRRELDRDRARGLISEPEVDAARAEIGRRLIAADERAGQRPGATRDARVTRTRRLGWALVLALAVPAVAFGAYLELGSPAVPGQPFAARDAVPVENQDLASLVGRVERHLQENPTDAEGWDAIAPAYMRLRRYDQAVGAFARAIRFGGESARRYSALGEARIFAADGMIDAGAREALERARALDPALPSPRYYLGLAAVQDGNVERAIAMWQELLATAPPDASWAGEVRRQLAQLRTQQDAPPAGAASSGATSTPGPSAADVAAAQAMSEEERGAMIEGMVAGLAARLEEDGDDLEGWLRLARAYVVLGRTDDARAALARAREAFTGQSDAIGRLDEAARELGLGS